MIEVSQEQWVNWAVLAGFAVTLFGYLGAMKRDLRSDMQSMDARLTGQIAELRTDLRDTDARLTGQLAGVDSRLTGQISGVDSRLIDEIGSLRAEIKSSRYELKSDIAEFRREVRDEFSKLDGRITTLEQRTYDLSTRLPPAPAHPS